MGDSLIGKTVDSGSIVPGSSPGLPAKHDDQLKSWSFLFYDHKIELLGLLWLLITQIE